MSVFKFKRFTRPQMLHQIGRPLLLKFFEKFQPELAACGVALPGPDLPDAEWEDRLAGLLSAPERLPGSLGEALYAIDEMATPEGQEQLELALDRERLALPFESGSSRHDLALQVWLVAPAILARLHNRQRLLRLTAFEYFGTLTPPGRRPEFCEPDEPVLQVLNAKLNAWFARHERGWNTCRIELHRFPGNAGSPGGSQYWFLIRHGDTYSRTPKVEEQRTEVLHFRPQRDDAVVYDHGCDELRVNARTRGERALYVRAFGMALRGSEDYFCARHTYTLEPLRTEGRDALQTGDVPGLENITLRAVEAAEEDTDWSARVESSDLFGQGDAGAGGAIPQRGRLFRADFDVEFAGCRAARAIQIRLPNVVKLRRHCDLPVLEPWLRRFRVAA